MHYKQLGSDILDQIIYRGEGNSSIVIAVKSHAKIIRLLKVEKKLTKSSRDHHSSQHPMRCIKFIQLIMKPLTAPFLSGSTKLIYLKSGFINRLSEKLEVHRPLYRLNKTLHLDDQYALVMDDLCTLPNRLVRQLGPNDFQGPTISVEIKPKQGFLPLNRWVMRSSTNDPLIATMRKSCLYSSNQFLKLSINRIFKMNDYCPVNLFSGCPMRMKSALKSLFLNPQNNLRVFKDLTLAFAENRQMKLVNVFEDFFIDHDLSRDTTSKTDLEDRLIDLLIQSLVNDHDYQDENKIEEEESEDENDFINSDKCLQHHPNTMCRKCDTYLSSKKYRSKIKPHHLSKSCVLYTVLSAQKLDTIGPHTALYMLEWLLENSKESGDNVDVLEELSKAQLPKGFGSPLQLPDESKQKYYFRKVWEYLVSLTAKDCSIIVTLRRISFESYHSISSKQPSLRKHLLKDKSSGVYYFFNVGIADLDQKMPYKIPRICDNLNLILKIKSNLLREESQYSSGRSAQNFIVGNS